jgi:hypothetical protein
MQKVMCAAITVRMLSSMCANRRKYATREIAITISGITSETKISVEYPDRPRNLNRVRANAASVPMIVAISVAVNATLSVFRKACSAKWSCASLPYHFVDTPVHAVPLLALLKLKTTSTTIGANRNAKTNTACSFR